jgi:2-polyprenyl-3-methyl-5-hydroxy-6-metoxy-1,4-benzoquinol methylase
MSYVGDTRRSVVLDFGCGGGVMLPFLADRFGRVLAMDIDLAPLAKLEPYIPRSGNVEVYDARRVTLSDFPVASVDVVLALDVLEHVSDLDGTLESFSGLLAPGGEIIVSAPTENLAYRIGRQVAGREFSGDYHVRGVGEIKVALDRLGPVKTVATLFHPVPLFRLYSVTLERGRRGSAVSKGLAR